jgi:very-short-patch-repair endonuclease
MRPTPSAVCGRYYGTGDCRTINSAASIGRFIVDFACTKHHLVIEADGGQHDQTTADAQRTAWLESQGWRVIRFWNNDVLTNTEGVLTRILEALRDG